MRALLATLATTALLALALTGCGARTGLGAPEGEGGSVARGKVPAYCTGDTPTPIFVVTDMAELFSFDPPSAAFTDLGPVVCDLASSPETMAVDHANHAYVTYQDGTMSIVDSSTLACTSTAFSDGPNGGRFGSCFAATQGGQAETLFLFDGQTSASAPNGALVRVDTQTFAVTTVGDISENLGGGELTGTGDGRLFAFGDASSTVPNDGSLAQLDPSDGNVLSDMPLALDASDSGFAFAFWGGDFYFFVGMDGVGTTVSQLAPDGTFTASYAALAGGNVVGAGVSTCAPTE
jgi:hypothetical protein